MDQSVPQLTATCYANFQQCHTSVGAMVVVLCFLIIQLQAQTRSRRTRERGVGWWGRQCGLRAFSTSSIGGLQKFNK